MSNSVKAHFQKLRLYIQYYKGLPVWHPPLLGPSEIHHSSRYTKGPHNGSICQDLPAADPGRGRAADCYPASWLLHLATWCHFTPDHNGLKIRVRGKTIVKGATGIHRAETAVADYWLQA